MSGFANRGSRRLPEKIGKCLCDNELGSPTQPTRPRRFRPLRRGHPRSCRQCRRVLNLPAGAGTRHRRHGELLRGFLGRPVTAE
jgi:hypothetical protein